MAVAVLGDDASQVLLAGRGRRPPRGPRTPRRRAWSPPPRASPDGARRASARGPPRRARARRRARSRSMLPSPGPPAAPRSVLLARRRTGVVSRSPVPTLGPVPRALSTLGVARRLLRSSWPACGSDEDGAPPAQPTSDRRARPTSRTPTGRRSSALQAETGQSLVFAPSVQELRKGTNRYGFALFDTARKQVTGAAVALSTRRAPTAAACAARTSRAPSRSRSAGRSRAARRRRIPTRPSPSTSPTCRSRATASRSSRRWPSSTAGSSARTRSRSTSGSAEASGPPEVGEKAIRVHTKTIADVGGDAGQISTRNPPAEDLLQTDLADVLGAQAGRHHLRHAAAVREPGVRPRRRHRRGGQGARAERRGLHPPGDLPRQPGRQGRPGRRWPAGGCAPSRGPS